MHSLQQHTGHPLQTFRQGWQTLDGPSDGAVYDQQHLVHHLDLPELPLDLSQTWLVSHPGLKQ